MPRGSGGRWGRSGGTWHRVLPAVASPAPDDAALLAVQNAYFAAISETTRIDKAAGDEVQADEIAAVLPGGAL